MKTIVSSLSEIPEPLRAEYEERDGAFHVKLEGEPKGFAKATDLAEANAKIVEFRDGNRKLNSEIGQLRDKFTGINPDEHKKLKDKVTELEKRGIKGGEDITSIVQKALSDAVTPLQKKLEEFTEREKTSKEALKRKDLESMLTQTGLNSGIAERAMPDYLRRGLEVWSFDDEGEPVARNGDKPLFSEVKPSEPLSPTEWTSMLKKQAAHLFKVSKGGGANQSTTGNGDPATYDSNDDAQFLGNVEKIAKGEMTARETT